MNLAPSVIDEIETRYITESLEKEKLDLNAFAEEYTIPILILQKTLKSKNWDTRRARNRYKFLKSKTESQSTEIAQAGLDLGKMQGKFLNDSYTMIETNLPILLEEVMLRVEDMDNKDAIALFKLFLDKKYELQQYILKVKDEINDEKKKAGEQDIASTLDLGLGARIIQATKGNTVVPDEEDKDVLFTELDGKR